MKILWADDEQELMAPFRIQVEQLGYSVEMVSNGVDALELFSTSVYDAVILDENMPGKNGLDVLVEMKRQRPETPIVMMTKSDETETMASAYGRNIDYYVVKTERPTAQLKACLMQILQRRELQDAASSARYMGERQGLLADMSRAYTFADWAALYQRLVGWELTLEGNRTMQETHADLKREANAGFAKCVARNYAEWLSGKSTTAPLLSHRVLSARIKPRLQSGEKVALVVVDNLRLDQWEVVRPLLASDFKIDVELYCSLLPTATQFARNALFSGLLPADIRKLHPQWWITATDSPEESYNQYERELLSAYFERQRMRGIKSAYYKANSQESGEQLVKKFGGYTGNNLNAIVYNFVDALSHSRTENRMLKDLTHDDAAYRSVTRSWFAHGIMRETLLLLRDKGFTIVLTTDHGAIRVQRPLEIASMRDVNSNLRYKTSKNMTYNAKSVYEVSKPETIGLPVTSTTGPYIFAQSDDFFCYASNKAEYVRQYTDSYQHGGISLEEMVIPLVVLGDKG